MGLGKIKRGFGQNKTYVKVVLSVGNVGLFRIKRGIKTEKKRVFGSD